MSDDNKTVFYDKHRQTHIIEHGDGSITAKSHQTTTRVDKDGTSHVTVGNLQSIGIKNIADLARYAITHEESLTRHAFEFTRGGHAVLEITSDGRLHSCVITGCGTQISKEGEVLITKNDKNGEAED